MEFPVSSLAILVSILNIIQLLTSVILYKMNPDRKGIFDWVIANIFFAIGFIFNYFRVIPSFQLYAIIFNNLFFIVGMSFFLIGINKILNKKATYPIVFLYSLILFAIIIYFTVVENNFSIRRISITAGIAIFSFFMAYSLGTSKQSSIKLTSRFSSIIFILNAISLLCSNAPLFFSVQLLNLTTTEILQLFTYLNSIIFSTLWTLGIVLLINQQTITEFKESRNNMEMLFNTSPDAILITRLSDGHFVGANEGFTRMTGYTNEEVFEKTTLQLDLWINSNDRNHFILQLKDTGVLHNAEYEYRMKDNSIITGLVSARVIDYQNEPHIISVIHDITNRKIADKKFRMLFELSPIGLSMVDNNTGRFLEVNKALLEMTGYTKEEFLQLTYWDITPNEYKELEEKQMKEILETGFFGPSEKEYIRKDGSRFQISISGVLINDPTGKNINWGFIEDITERKRLQAELKLQATTDELTGLYNRRHFLDLARKEIKRSIRNFHPASVAIFDLDRLKFFNDNFGHSFGDVALISFANQCKNNLREIDILARHGGDEFVVLLPETTIEEAEVVLERIRKIINQTNIKIDEKEFNISTSIGLATLEHRNDILDDILARADAALYQAKDQGKNRIVIKSDPDFNWPAQL